MGGIGEVEDLREEAIKASARAYAPYSRFRVGACVLTSRGKIYSAANVENSSYGLTICAERAAVFKAVSEEGPQIEVKAVYIYAADSMEPEPPCGACLQVLAEFAGGDVDVYLESGDGKIEAYKLSQLLPKAFRLRAGGG